MRQVQPQQSHLTTSFVSAGGGNGVIDLARPNSWPKAEVPGKPQQRSSLDGEMLPKQVHWNEGSAFSRPAPSANRHWSGASANLQDFNPHLPPPLPPRGPQQPWRQNAQVDGASNVLPVMPPLQEILPEGAALPPVGHGNRLESIQQMMERMEALSRQLQTMDVARNIEKRVPTFTEIYSEPPADIAYDGELNGREYFLQNLTCESDKVTENASATKTFLQDAMYLGKDRRLSHSAAIRLINRHTRKGPKAIVADEMRDPEVTLESVVRALELRYMNLVSEDQALSQIYAIVREPGENLHSIQSRLLDRAQMSTRSRPREVRVQEEQALCSSRFLAILPPNIRNIIRERERMRKSMGREPYTLSELVEEAITAESEHNQDEDQARKQETQQLWSSRSYSLLNQSNKSAKNSAKPKDENG